MRKANANKKARRLGERVIKTKEKNKRELEKAKRDPNYKPKIKRSKRR